MPLPMRGTWIAAFAAMTWGGVTVLHPLRYVTSQANLIRFRPSPCHTGSDAAIHGMGVA